MSGAPSRSIGRRRRRKSELDFFGIVSEIFSKLAHRSRSRSSRRRRLEAKAFFHLCCRKSDMCLTGKKWKGRNYRNGRECGRSESRQNPQRGKVSYVQRGLRPEQEAHFAKILCDVAQNLCERGLLQTQLQSYRFVHDHRKISINMKCNTTVLLIVSCFFFYLCLECSKCKTELQEVSTNCIIT